MKVRGIFKTLAWKNAWVIFEKPEGKFRKTLNFIIIM